MALSTDQLALLNLLAPGDYAWADLDAAQQQLLSATLRPTGPFTDEQRSLLADWYLLITPEQVSTANATLDPLGQGVGSRQTSDGRTVTKADLLTDCVQPTDNYHAIAPILTTLPITLVPPDQFPQPEPEDI